jgi:hypothetical protein
MSFGPYAVRVLRSEVAPGIPDARWDLYRGPALALDLDGEWQGDGRVIMPGQVYVDGVCRGIRLARGIDATAPEPLGRIEIPLDEPRQARTVTLVGSTFQLRGPWIVGFPVR